MTTDHRPGSDLIYCQSCHDRFTPTNWRLHGHNSSQISCNKCRRKAVGHSLRLLLCSEHLVEALRRGNQVTFVDGRACGLCQGHGVVHGQEVGPAPGGKWMRCTQCQGSGYDPELRQDRLRRQQLARERSQREEGVRRRRETQRGAEREKEERVRQEIQFELRLREEELRQRRLRRRNKAIVPTGGAAYGNGNAYAVSIADSNYAWCRRPRRRPHPRQGRLRCTWSLQAGRMKSTPSTIDDHALRFEWDATELAIGDIPADTRFAAILQPSAFPKLTLIDVRRGFINIVSLAVFPSLYHVG